MAASSTSLTRRRLRWGSIATAKIGDFGLANVSQTMVQTNMAAAERGTWAWKAPETFQGRYSRASDVFGLAMTAFEVAARAKPWQGCRDLEIYDHIRNNRRPNLAELADDECPALLQTLIVDCWAENANDRLETLAIQQQLEAVHQQLQAQRVQVQERVQEQEQGPSWS